MIDANQIEYPWKKFHFDKHFWPGDARMAFLVNFEYEVLRTDRTRPDGSPDIREMSSREYEARNGLHRLLGVFDKFGLKSTAFVAGATADLFPDTVEELVERGHEVAAHGYSGEDIPPLGEQAEREHIARIVSAIENVTHERPVGWMCPRCQPSDFTMDILADLGFVWNSDMFDADMPYILEASGRKLLEIPRTFATDDIMMPNTDPTAMFGAWRDEFDCLYRESAETPKMMTITIHPYITGRPSRSIALERALEHIMGHDGIWFAQNGELADHCLQKWS